MGCVQDMRTAVEIGRELILTDKVGAEE